MMTMQRTPTESMRASAQAHLELRGTWRYYRQGGVRYVAVTSANSGRVRQVRADSNGCDCDAYLVWGYTACSHMLSVREAANRDALTAWVDDLEQPSSANRAGVLGYLEAVSSGADHEGARAAGHTARKTYEQIWQEG